MTEVTESFVDKCLAEICHQWEPTRVGSRQLEYMTLAELCNYLESCGLPISEDTEDRYALLLALRNTDFKEQMLDGMVTFVMFR